jgi:multidrug efflux pump subunit AcrA (membrane-fusion protein)
VNISTASGAIVALADLDTLEVEVDVAESNVAKLGAEQPAEVTAEAFPDRRYKARLRQVIPTADRTKATVQVKVTILDRDKDLKPEMSARVQFLTPEPAKTRALSNSASEPPRTVVTVPATTIAIRDAKSVVFEIVEGVAKQRVVETATGVSGRTTIKSGLYGGETLVDSPGEAVKDGMRVKVKS